LNETGFELEKVEGKAYGKKSKNESVKNTPLFKSKQRNSKSSSVDVRDATVPTIAEKSGSPIRLVS